MAVIYQDPKQINDLVLDSKSGKISRKVGNKIFDVGTNDPRYSRLLSEYSSKQGTTFGDSKGTGYNPYVQAQEQANQLLQSQKQAQLNNANAMYDGAAKQAYIVKMQNEANAPTLAMASGATGGLSETSAIAPGLAYNQALSQISGERNKTVNDIGIASDTNALNMAMDYADRIIGQQNTDRQFGQQASQLSLEQAMQAAQLGDFSRLEALGYNPAGAKSDYANRNNIYDALLSAGLVNDDMARYYNTDSNLLKQYVNNMLMGKPSTTTTKTASKSSGSSKKSSGGSSNGYVPINDNTAEPSKPAAPSNVSVYIVGYGRASLAEAERLEQQGKIVTTKDSAGKNVYMLKR